PNYEYINVKSAMEDKDSILHYYRDLIALRTENTALIYGEYEEILHEHKHVYAYTRTLENEVWVVLCNMSQEKVQVSLPAHLRIGEILLSNVKKTKHDQTMLGYEACVIRVVKD